MFKTSVFDRIITELENVLQMVADMEATIEITLSDIDEMKKIEGSIHRLEEK